MSMEAAQNSCDSVTKSASFRKWRKLLTTISVSAVIGFLLFQNFRPEQSKKSKNFEDGDEKKSQNRTVFKVYGNLLNTKGNEKVYCTVQSCERIICSEIPADLDPGVVAANFIESRFKVDCGSIRSVCLSIERCKFPSNSLNNGWLKTDIFIEELTIDSCSLNEITDDAFSLDNYRRTHKLSILNNNVHTLRRNLFGNLTGLKQLTIRDNTIESAEYDLLGLLAKTLENLELDNSIGDPKVLENITGASPLPKVEILSIRGNSIPVMNSNIFAGLTKVQSLFMEMSEVRLIEPGTFDPMAKTILLLIMNSNKISTLPFGLFDHIFRSGRQFRVSLENNPWHCDCELKWLQDLIKSHPTAIQTIPTCATPMENFSKLFTKAEFCNQTTTTQRDENSSGTTEISGPTEPTTDKMAEDRCPEIVFGFRTTTRFRFSGDVQRKSRFVEFSIREYGERHVLVQLPNVSLNLVWFQEGTKIFCAMNVRKSYTIRNLRPRTIYTICLLEPSSTIVSPLDCLNINTDPEYTMRTWLRNGDKPFFLTLTILSMLIALILSGAIVFVLVRRYPSLLRGSKRVMLVKKRNVDAIVLPRGVNLKEPPLLRSDHVDGYVTPLPPIRSRKCSTGSVQSDVHSYVSDVDTHSRTGSWRLKILGGQPEPEKISLPPLPPRPRFHEVPSLSLRIDSKAVRSSKYSPNTI